MLRAIDVRNANYIRGNNSNPPFVNKDKDIMIANLACCTLEHTVRQAAEMMVRHDCGEIAIVESVENLKPIGVITDRDIAWRVVATGKSPARDAVEPSVTVTPKSFYGALASGSKEVK